MNAVMAGQKERTVLRWTQNGSKWSEKIPNLFIPNYITEKTKSQEEKEKIRDFGVDWIRIDEYTGCTCAACGNEILKYDEVAQVNDFLFHTDCLSSLTAAELCERAELDVKFFDMGDEW